VGTRFQRKVMGYLIDTLALYWLAFKKEIIFFVIILVLAFIANAQLSKGKHRPWKASK